MAFNLNIMFGGLCMFVVSDDPRGTFVLLPDTAMAMPPHCPMLLTWKENYVSPLAHDQVIPIVSENDADLRALAPEVESRPATEHHPQSLEVRAASGRHTHYLLDAPADDVAARVILPWGVGLKTVKSGAMIAPGSANPQQAASMISVMLKVSGSGVTVFGEYLTPDTNGDIDIGVLNIPRAHLDGKNRGATKGAPATHLAHFYNLLASPTSRPPVKQGADQVADPNAGSDMAFYVGHPDFEWHPLASMHSDVHAGSIESVGHGELD